MMPEVAAPQDPARRRLVSRSAAGASALIALLPTLLVVVNELESEFAEGETIESHEVVTIAFIVVVVVGIAFGLITSTLRSIARPELFLAAATGALIAVGMLTFWLGGAYAVAAALAIVAWRAGRMADGTSIAAQMVAPFVSAAAVFALSVGENALSDALWP
jgi:hypothetical protein